MNTKFTKGPWKTHTEYGLHWNVSSVRGAPIALASPPNALAHPDWQVERTANTALIASAPELYEALAMLAEYPLEAFGKENSKPETPLFGANGWTLTVGDVLNARAVLKKARGEQ